MRMGDSKWAAQMHNFNPPGRTRVKTQDDTSAEDDTQDTIECQIVTGGQDRISG